MKKTIVFILIIALLFTFAACKKKWTDEPVLLGARTTFEITDDMDAVNNVSAKVVLLYGQSNATGVASCAYLAQKSPLDYAEAVAGYQNVLINFITENGANSSGGSFVPTTLGQGASKDYFGPEVGIASELSKRHPDETVFIIKYSWGGSILHNQWLDGNGEKGELYTAAHNFTVAALDYLRGKGYLPEISAVCWMQGESDAVYENRASAYYTNTQNLVTYLRSDLADYYSTPFRFIDAGIAEIPLWIDPYTVNNSKSAFADTDANNFYFSTSAMGLTTNLEPEGAPDLAHYDSQSALALGKKFAEFIP